MLRTGCHRVAFQSSTSDLLRVSIDTDLTFTKVVSKRAGHVISRCEAAPLLTGQRQKSEKGFGCTLTLHFSSMCLLMLQEAGAHRAGGEWCRGGSAPLARGDRQRFPYAVVEIKLRGTGQPAWIRRLVDSGAQGCLHSSVTYVTHFTPWVINVSSCVDR